MTGVGHDIPDLLRWASVEPAELYRELRASPEGLPEEEARVRLRTHGPNELPTARPPSVAAKILLQVRNLFNMLLLFASSLSFLAGYAFADTGSVQMGVGILAVVLFNVGFNLLQERRAEKMVEALRRLIPANARVARGGRFVHVPVVQLVPGDVFAIEEGDRVPADARVISAFQVSVDQSVLTGESAPRERSAAPARREVRDPAECPNLILAGTTIASGSGTALVLATGARTVFGRVVSATREVKEAPSPLQRQLSAMGRLNFAVAFAVGLSFLLIAIAFRDIGLLGSLLFMIGVMISLVPEGLQLTVTLALAQSSIAMSRRKVVVKRLAAVEALGSATVICTDKTGTITTGQMTLRKVWADGVTFDVTGEGYNPEGRVLLDGRRISWADREDLRKLSEIATFDNKATVTPPLDRRRRRWTAVGDPTDAALLVFGLKTGLDARTALLGNPRVALIPFDSDRKMMTSVHRDANGRVTAFAKGAGHAILDRSTKYLTAEGEAELTPDVRARIEGQIDRFARDAYRVLALAYRSLDVPRNEYMSETTEQDLTFAGLVAIHDPPRPDVPEAVVRARSAGIKVFMITGDHELTAGAIGRRVGILTSEDSRVITGSQLEGMSDSALAGALAADELVFARIAPNQKFRVVKALKARGETVAVTGDGVNDAPALAEADAGIAMGITGTDVARESAALVLLDDNFASIMAGIEQGRGVFDNLRGLMIYLFSHNWAQLMSLLAFVLLGVPLAITVPMILSIDLVLEIPQSLALTVEPPHPAVMDRPPRRTGTRLFDLRALFVSAYVGIPVGVLGLVAAAGVWTQGGWSFGTTVVPDSRLFAEGATVAYAAIMLGQAGNLLARRAGRASAFALSPRRNRWLVPGILGTLGGLTLFVYLPVTQSVLGLAGLSAPGWGIVLLFLPLVLVLEEARKVVARMVFPEVPVRAPAFAPIAGEPGPLYAPGASLARSRSGSVETAPPVLLGLFLRPTTWGAIPVALQLAAFRGSRLTVVRILEGETSPELVDALGEGIRRLAEERDVAVDVVDARVGLTSGDTPGRSLRQVAERVGPGTIVVPVDRDTFRRPPAWLADLSATPVILAYSPPRAEPPPWPRRILVPVLREFHQGPFDIAAALTVGSVVPEVDVVAARVVSIPPITPIYSTYRPESLVDVDHELSFLRRLTRLGFSGSLSEKVLVVRDVGRDVVDFAEDGNVDAIILRGNWTDRRRGFLAKQEQPIALRARCTVLVTLPASPRT